MDRKDLRELFDRHDIPPNHALSYLPPLPQTPHTNRHALAEYASDDADEKYQPRSQRRRGPDRPEREYPSSTVRRHANGGGDEGRLPRSTTLPSLSTGNRAAPRKSQIDSHYPMLSTRQSSMNTARNISPVKADFLPPTQPSALLHPSSAATPSSATITSRTIVSASFMLPAGADMSMLQDVTFGELGRVSLGNDTVELDTRVGMAAASGHGSAVGVTGVSAPMVSPIKRGSRPPAEPFAQSNLLPRTPARGSSTSTAPIELSQPSTVVAESHGRAPSTLRTSRPSGSIRRLPPSTSSNFLTVPTQDHAGDASTLLPVSPLKTRHLLSDEHLLTHTKMEDETMLSMSLLMPPLVGPVRRASPAKTPRSAKPRTRAEGADQTMDIQQMMARANQARGVGVEESVVDLFRADMDDDDMNISMVSNTFIPPDLRPGLVRSKSLSRLEMEKRATDRPRANDAQAEYTRTLPRTRPTSYIELGAQPSPTRTRPVVAPAPIASRRVSLSVGALPLPSSASMRKLDSPLRRIASPVKPIARPAGPVPATRSVLPRPAAKSSMPPSAVKASQPPKPRTGSTTSLVPARSSTLPRAPTVRTTTVPAQAARTGIRPAPVEPKPTSRPLARPLPTGSSARPTASTVPRSFGGDAAGVSNRLPRPPTSSTLPTRAAKGSMGPPGLPRPTIPAVSAAKARTLSTPATTVIKPPSSIRPTTTTTSRPPTVRAAALPTSRPIPSARVPTTSGSTLPRSVPSTAPSSTHPSATISKSSSRSTTAAGLADIRARLDKLQARHQTSRVPR